MKTMMKSALFSAAAALALTAILPASASAQSTMPEFEAFDLQLQQAVQTSGDDPIKALTDTQRRIILFQRFVELEKLKQELASVRLDRLKVQNEVEGLGEVQNMDQEERIKYEMRQAMINDPRLGFAALGGIGFDQSGNMMPTPDGDKGGLFNFVTPKSAAEQREIENPKAEPSDDSSAIMDGNGDSTEKRAAQAVMDEAAAEQIAQLNAEIQQLRNMQMVMMAEDEKSKDRGTPAVSKVIGSGNRLSAVVLFPSGGQYVMRERDEREGWVVRSITSTGVRACDQESEDRKMACRNLPFGMPIMPEVTMAGMPGGGFGMPGGDNSFGSTNPGFEGYGVPIGNVPLTP